MAVKYGKLSKSRQRWNKKAAMIQGQKTKSSKRVTAVRKRRRQRNLRSRKARARISRSSLKLKKNLRRRMRRRRSNQRSLRKTRMMLSLSGFMEWEGKLMSLQVSKSTKKARKRSVKMCLMTILPVMTMTQKEMMSL